MAEHEDPYDVLRVSRSASAAEIRKSYQELARKVCPLYTYYATITVYTTRARAVPSRQASGRYGERGGESSSDREVSADQPGLSPAHQHRISAGL